MTVATFDEYREVLLPNAAGILNANIVWVDDGKSNDGFRVSSGSKTALLNGYYFICPGNAPAATDIETAVETDGVITFTSKHIDIYAFKPSNPGTVPSRYKKGRMKVQVNRATLAIGVQFTLEDGSLLLQTVDASGNYALLATADFD